MFEGFVIFGLRVFDFREPFSYFEVFSTMFVVLGSFLAAYLILANKAKKFKRDTAKKDSVDSDCINDSEAK